MANWMRYLTHPEVEVEPNVPVPRWKLSDKGRQRVLNLSERNSLLSVGRIVSSSETKAVETATILAKTVDLKFQQRCEMHENDRTSTGYMPADEFEKAADAFFASPNESFKGWETANDAQQRIVSQVTEILVEPRAKPIERNLLIVGHGAVGTLLYCYFARQPIDRKFDQKGGGGNFFSVDLDTLSPLSHWVPMEEF